MWELDKGIAKNNVIRRWEDKIKRLKKVIQEISIFRGKKEDRDKKTRLANIQELRARLVLDPGDRDSSACLTSVDRRRRTKSGVWRLYEIVDSLGFIGLKKGICPLNFSSPFLRIEGLVRRLGS